MLSSALMAVSVGRMLSFFYLLVIIHLGKNLDSGGRPPNDPLMVRIRIVMETVFFHVCDNDSFWYISWP